MGLSNNSIIKSKKIKKREIGEIESSICKIISQNTEDGNKGSSIGFFCEINDDNIPFKKALFTNNHILNENSIEINKEIEFEYLNEKKKIIITKDRKVFTSEELDYTCIEIFNSDNINNFFIINNKIFHDGGDLKNKDIFILQYLDSKKISYCFGEIIDINIHTIKYKDFTVDGSSVSPLFIRDNNNNLILGIQFGLKKEAQFNLATPFNIIINDIKASLYDNININNDNKIIEYKNKINLTYYFGKWYSSNRIFGEKFVENNKDNITLIINGKENELISEYNLKEGGNNIQIIIKNKLTNLEYMFYNCLSLINIEELAYLNTKDVNNFSYIFGGCSLLSNIKPLKNWDVSNGINFSHMFYGCESLSDINPLQNWNISKANNFKSMFCGCSSLCNIMALQNWNISNVKNLSFMFSGCSSLSNLKSLENWNISNSINFSGMFRGCSLLSNIRALRNWNVSNAINFSYLFFGCESLSNIKPIENWNVSNVNNYSFMFYECNSISDLKALENWNVSNGNNFSAMFSGCSSLSDINSLKNWNVSNGSNFTAMFCDCSSLSNINELKNWSLSNRINFDILFKRFGS